MARVTIKIDGLAALVSKVKDGDTLVTRPLRRFFTKSGVLVTGEAKRLTPVDTGRLRAANTYKLDPSPTPMFVEVGNAVHYAPFVHEPGRTRRWAGKPFLRDALLRNVGRIEGFVRETAKEIEALWRK